jgi:hypothetical protein
MAEQVRPGYPQKNGLTKTADYLPHLQLSEFMQFIQIGFGNPHTVGELIGLEPSQQTQFSSTLNLFGAVNGFGGARFRGLVIPNLYVF